MKHLVLKVGLVFAIAGLCYGAVYAEVKKKVTIFPFNDLTVSRIDLQSSAIIEAELSKIGFIELVPAEVVRQKVLDFEPAFLWTGRMTGRSTSRTTTRNTSQNSAQSSAQSSIQNTTRNIDQSTGGILWNINTRIVEQVSRGLSSDYSVYGDVTGGKDKLQINVRITDNDAKVLRTISAAADDRDGLPQAYTRIGKRAASFFEEATVVERAEDEVRSYLAGLDSIGGVVAKVQRTANRYPRSMPLRAILLDLYLREKALYSSRIEAAANEVIELYNPANGDDARYLAALYLDPYDVLAAPYEARRNWTRAIAIREKALRDFPFFFHQEKLALGHAYFMMAQEFELKRDGNRAANYYRKAISVLPTDNDDSAKSVKRLKDLEARR
jgi:hypothetical protein